MIAIDLGSNTLRVLEYDCTTGEQIFSYEKVVRTADGLVEHGKVNNAAIGRVVAAIQEAQAQIDFSSSVIKAVTTEAVRRAENSDDVLLQIKERTGVAFDIISGEEEARLTLLAVKHRLSTLDHDADHFVVIDIGGGSTELIFHYENETISKSFPVGIVTIAQTYGILENIEKALPQEMSQMQLFCSEVYEKSGKVNAFVATAGTPTTVASMKLGLTYETYDAAKINGTSLEVNELDIYLRKLLSMPLEEREITVGTGRSDLIAAGILIYKQLFTILEFDRCVIIDDGLREGVAIDVCMDDSY
ncbi:MAG: phosphatase [Epsilonproteobacteria bacterium]|nr:MAG: phosphatase [Campylobacterota bacterium]